MGWVLRRSSDRINPTLPGGVYGKYITAGRGVYWRHDGSRVRFIVFISDGGLYGMNAPTTLEYKAVPIPDAEYKFHPGRFTKQIEPKAIMAVNHASDTLTTADGIFADDDPVRLHARGGNLPAPLSSKKKYFIRDYASGVFKVSETEGGTAEALTDNGSGTLTMWKAKAGFDDPDQGLPDWCPEVETTFSGISYVEGLIPAAYTEAVEPEWDEFRFAGIGRILMDYDDEGNEAGTTTDPELCANPALCDADDLIVSYKKPLSRIDWPSWYALRIDALVKLWQRIDPAESGTGFIGKYYNFTGSVPPDIEDATLVLTRRDPVINFDFGISSPGVPVNDDFMAVYDGRLKAKFSEEYTFEVERDNGARLIIDGDMVIDAWTNTFGTSSGARTMIADEFVNIRVEFFDAGGPGKIILKWQSASQPLEVIPMQAVYEADAQVNRYEVNIASAAPMEAAAVHEMILQRCPGWDWTDRDGKIVYLPPDRPIVYGSFLMPRIPMRSIPSSTNPLKRNAATGATAGTLRFIPIDIACSRVSRNSSSRRTAKSSETSRAGSPTIICPTNCR
jgi:PA14 domain